MKWKVGILGATGAVGQRMIEQLENHPWFTAAELAASERSAGKTYREAVRWTLDGSVPSSVANLIVKPAAPPLDCDFVLSALDSSVAGPVEEEFASAGFPVISNSKNHRMADDVPLLIPEINASHLDILASQKKRRGYTTGCLITNPNCSTVGLAMALKPLDDAFGVQEVFVVTMQAISGAGYPGVPSLDILDNVVPYISGEEDKVQTEPLKILGVLKNNSVEFARMKISAQCNRVHVLDGHTECVSIRLRRKASLQEVRHALSSFTGDPQRMNLPFAPEHPILVTDDDDRPQPRRDRSAGKGMTVVVGRVRPCELLDYKFTLLVHNTIRGAAGAAILNAELLAERGELPHLTPVTQSVAAEDEA
jgi:aspartate-semialdehyde dehydrogenase